MDVRLPGEEKESAVGRKRGIGLRLIGVDDRAEVSKFAPAARFVLERNIEVPIPEAAFLARVHQQDPAVGGQARPAELADEKIFLEGNGRGGVKRVAAARNLKETARFAVLPHEIDPSVREESWMGFDVGGIVRQDRRA